jgi:hypothetical protein
MGSGKEREVLELVTSALTDPGLPKFGRSR